MTGPRIGTLVSVKTRVRDWVNANPGTHHVRDISRGAHVLTRNAHQALVVLAKAGEIRRVGKGTYQQIEAATAAGAMQ